MNYESQGQDFNDKGEPRSQDEWSEYTYPSDRRDGIKRSITKKRGCGAATGLIIACILLPLIALYAVAMTVAAGCVALHEWVIK